MFKKNTTKLTLIGLGFTLLLSLIMIFVSMIAFTSDNIVKSGKNEIETNNLLVKYTNPDYVICSKDILKPEIIFYGGKTNPENSFFLIYSKYSRGNIFSNDWQITNNGGGSVSNSSSEQVKKILSSKSCSDLQKSQTIDGVNITYNSPITKEQAQKELQQDLEFKKQQQEKNLILDEKGIPNRNEYIDKCIQASGIEVSKTPEEIMKPIVQQCDKDHQNLVIQKGLDPKDY